MTTDTPARTRPPGADRFLRLSIPLLSLSQFAAAIADAFQLNYDPRAASEGA